MDADRPENATADTGIFLYAAECDMAWIVGRTNLGDRFDNTRKILVGQQGEEIRLELLNRDVKLLS